MQEQFIRCADDCIYCNLVQEGIQVVETCFQDERLELEENPDGKILSMVVTMDDWEQLCVEMDYFKSPMEHETEDLYATMSAEGARRHPQRHQNRNPRGHPAR